MHRFSLLLLGLGFAGCCLAAEPAVTVKIKDADSPDGKLTLLGLATEGKDGWSTVQVEVQSVPDKKVLGRIVVPEYDPGDQRYSITAVWREDGGAFGLNVDHGRNITKCQFLVRGKSGWTELGLPKKAVQKLQKEGNKDGGKAQDYMDVAEWLPGGKVKISYAGNMGRTVEAVFHLVPGAKPRFDYVETIEPKEPLGPRLTPLNCTVRVLAGTGTAGAVDGPAAEAQFRWPSGVVLDAAGNIYVADRGNHTLRRITAQGMVETVAGSPGQFGKEDGTGKDARFWYPQALALDGAGNVIVADTSSKRVRKVSPQGAVTTLAEGFNYPTGVAVDKEGNVFVADGVGHVIRKISPDGKTAIVAGKEGVADLKNGPVNEARFRFPMSILINPDGALYVSDEAVIRKITKGMVSTLVGVFGETRRRDGSGNDVRLIGPSAMALDAAGNLYVADGADIRHITADGVATTLRVAGKDESPFTRPFALAVDASGRLYVADQDANVIFLVEVPKQGSF